MQAGFVQPIVEKAERVLVICDQIVIKQRDNGRRGLYIGDQSDAREWSDGGGE